jgi:hypothetical protein
MEILRWIDHTDIARPKRQMIVVESRQPSSSAEADLLLWHILGLLCTAQSTVLEI